ncbi:MAG: PQQ-dependent sugar dehydrogenase [Chitinophagales bacterium]
MIKYLTLPVLSMITYASYPQTPHLALELFSTGYSSPVDIVSCGDSRLFVVQQTGYIYTCDSDGVKSPTPFLDIHDKLVISSEQGLLGLAFDPEYLTNRTFYVYYTKKGGNTDIRIVRYKTDSMNAELADTGTAQILMSIPHPAFYNHDGGGMKFGPDGYLYAGTGDGGSGGDPFNNAQNPKEYLGKLLRIDVHKDSLYAIPADNPFVNDSTFYPEIYAYGLRNPWRFSFDRFTGDLWIGDVGQGLWEEVDYTSAPDTGGQNYGWHCYEGTHNYTVNDCNGTNGLTWPVAEYKHQFSDNAVIGGFVYRGSKYQSMFGKYFFTDNGSGKFRMITHNPDGTFTMDSIADGLIMPDAYSFASFGEDEKGEIYVANAANGKIYHLTDTSCAPVAAIIEAVTDSILCIGTALNAVSASGFDYQWMQDSAPISGATNSIYSASQEGYFSVQVTNAEGCSSISISVHITGNPSPVSILPVDADSVICIYQSSIALAADSAGGVFSGDGVSSGSFDPFIAGEGLHTIFYTFTNGMGCVSVDSQVVFVDVCTGLNPDWEKSGINIFPNPNDGSMTILLKDTNEAVDEISILNVSGQLLLRLVPDEYSNTQRFIRLDLKNFSSGLYTMKIIQGGRPGFHKFVISH